MGCLGRAGDRPVRRALADRLRGRGNRLGGDRPHHGMPTSRRHTASRQVAKVANGRDNRSRAPTLRSSCDAVSFYSCWGCLVIVVPTGPAQAITRGMPDDGRHPTSESCCSTCPTRWTPSSRTRARGSRAPALWSIPPTSSPRVTATVKQGQGEAQPSLRWRPCPSRQPPFESPGWLARRILRPSHAASCGPPGSRARPGTPGRPPHVSKATQTHFLTTSDGSRRRHVIPVAGLRASGGSGSAGRV